MMREIIRRGAEVYNLYTSEDGTAVYWGHQSCAKFTTRADALAFVETDPRPSMSPHDAPTCRVPFMECQPCQNIFAAGLRTLERLRK